MNIRYAVLAMEESRANWLSQNELSPLPISKRNVMAKWNAEDAIKVFDSRAEAKAYSDSHYFVTETSRRQKTEVLILMISFTDRVTIGKKAAHTETINLNLGNAQLEASEQCHYETKTYNYSELSAKNPNKHHIQIQQVEFPHCPGREIMEFTPKSNRLTR